MATMRRIMLSRCEITDCRLSAGQRIELDECVRVRVLPCVHVRASECVHACDNGIENSGGGEIEVV